MTTLNIPPGICIDDACRKANQLASEAGEPIRFVFNGVEVETRPDEDWGLACDRWFDESSRRFREQQAAAKPATGFLDFERRVKALAEQYHVEGANYGVVVRSQVIDGQRSLLFSAWIGGTHLMHVGADGQTIDATIHALDAQLRAKLTPPRNESGPDEQMQQIGEVEAASNG